MVSPAQNLRHTASMLNSTSPSMPPLVAPWYVSLQLALTWQAVISASSSCATSPDERDQPNEVPAAKLSTGEGSSEAMPVQGNVASVSQGQSIFLIGKLTAHEDHAAHSYVARSARLGDIRAVWIRVAWRVRSIN